MGLESVTNIADFVVTNPTGGDNKSQGDDHIRNIKVALANDFAGFTGAVMVTGTDGGAANAYTLTPANALPAYGTKMAVVFAPTVTNTGASTLNISGLGVKSINSVSGAALVSGDLVVGSLYIGLYTGTEFRLLTPTKNYIDQLAFLAALPAQAGKASGSAVLTDGAGVANWFDPVLTAAAGGTADAITATFTPGATLRDQQKCVVVCAGANTSTTPTFAPNGLVAHTITMNGGLPLQPGSIPGAGFVALLEYNLANTRWELLNPMPRLGALATNPMSANLTLTNTSALLQTIAPNAANLAVNLPAANTMAQLGQSFTIRNVATAGVFPVQILDNAGNLVGWSLPGLATPVYLENLGSAAGQWRVCTGTKSYDTGFYDWGCSTTYTSAAAFSLNNTAGMSSQMLDAELGLVMFYSVGTGIVPAAVRLKDGGVQNGAIGTAITTLSGYLSMCQNGASEVVALLPQNPIKAVSYVINTSTLALTSQTAVTKAAVATATTNLDWQANANLYYTYTETTTNKAWCGSLTGNGAGITFNTAVQLSATAGMKSSKIAAMSSTLSHQLAWDGSTIYASRATWSGTTPTPGAQTTVASRSWIANYVDAMEIVRTSATVSLAVYGGVDSNTNNSSASIYANVITDTGAAITTSETRLVDGFSAVLTNSSKMQFVNAQKGVGGSINVICSDGTSLKQATVKLVNGVPVISPFVEKQLPGPLWSSSSANRYDNCVPTSMRGVSGSYLFPIPVWTGSTALAQDLQTANTNVASIVYQPQCIAPQ